MKPTEAAVVLPDHLHCIWTLPTGDDGFSMRWGLIKSYFSRTIENGERLSASLSNRGERGIWQRRFWDHHVRDDADSRAHLDDIHWNPVKHGLVKHVADWEHSSLHRFVERGWYPANWGCLNLNLCHVAGE
ncbi:MAG: transposase [Methylococcaceae bacterium]|nr:transposase [Methylococcaceae bacterium]